MNATTLALTVFCSAIGIGAASELEVSRNLRHASSSQHRELQVELSNQFCWVPFTSCEADSCETVSPLGTDEFNLTKYIEKSWFIQKQQVNPYQSEDQLYCVVATYDTREGDDLLQVQNSAMTGGVNGVPQSSDTDAFFSSLCARQIEAGELEVAPCVFQSVFDWVAGPYWVLALGEDEAGEEYNWAIVSGGQPTERREVSLEGNETAMDTRTFCTNKQGRSFLDINGSGLWLFTKEQVASEATIAAMEAKLIEMGIYTGDLLPVVQEGCTYPESTKF